eukprot:1923766-Prorocentrum_lima.AAC.1
MRDVDGVEAKHSERVGQLRTTRRPCGGYTVRSVQKSGEWFTLQNGEEVPYTSTDEGSRNNQDLEG